LSYESKTVFLAFLKTIGITTGVAWGCLALPLYFLAEPMIIWGSVLGCALSAVCFTAGFYAVCRTFHRSFQALMLTVCGGMLARLLVVGATFMLLMTLTSLHVVSFLSSLLGFYIMYLIIELHFINSRLQSQEER
jgi:hypothetical protein